MSNLQEIKAPVSEQLIEFEKVFKSTMKTRVPLLDKVLRYILKRKGKQIRPLFVFLTANMTGKSNEATYRAASLIELLHTASLVHDDVVDDSNDAGGFSLSMPCGKIKLQYWLATICCPGACFFLLTIRISNFSELYLTPRGR